MVPAIRSVQPATTILSAHMLLSVSASGSALAPASVGFRKRETHVLKGSVSTCQASSAWSNLPLAHTWEKLRLFFYYTNWSKEREFPKMSP